MKVSKVNISLLNQKYEQFQVKTIGMQSIELQKFRAQINNFQKKYKSVGLGVSFAESLYKFAEIIKDAKIPDLPGIIYSTLVKMPFISDTAKETYAISGYEYSKKQNDPIHMLARLIDLKILYKKSKDCDKFQSILVKEEKVLSNICSNFPEAKNNFRSFAKTNTNRKHYEIELAMVRVDIAKSCIKSNPRRAEKLLNRAIKIFDRERMVNELVFAKQLIYEANRKKICS